MTLPIPADNSILTATFCRRIERALGVAPSAVEGEPVPDWWDRVAVPVGFMPYHQWQSTDNGTVSAVMISALVRVANERADRAPI